MSRGTGAGARWQEMTHPVNSKGPQEDKGRQGPPDGQETTPLGGKGLSADKDRWGNKAIWRQPSAHGLSLL